MAPRSNVKKVVGDRPRVADRTGHDHDAGARPRAFAERLEHGPDRARIQGGERLLEEELHLLGRQLHHERARARLVAGE